MEKKLERYGVEHLMTAAVNLSQLAMVSSTSAVIPPSILKPSVEPAVSSRYPTDLSTVDKYNWLLHVMYGRGDYERLQQFIAVHLHKSTYMTYAQALIHRQEGRINEALDHFQKCVLDDPSLVHIKQVGKSLALLGRYRLAIDAYKDALARTTNDWEVLHNLGLCYFHLNDLTEAKKYFLQALQVSEMQEASYLSLGKIYLLENERGEAEAVFKRGVSRNPESPTLFTEIGLMAFEKANYNEAFECFGTALTFCPTHIPAIMAACQVIQKHGDADVALSKYRIVYGRKPECAQVWNNIGMCFFSKKKYVAAVSCLKRANYLAPFELYALYNLALVHLHLQQNASAAVFLQSAIRLNRKHAPSYALLGVTLSKLNDRDNALRAFTYSLKLDPTDPVTLLNWAIFQKNTDVAQANIEATVQQFYHCYNRQVAPDHQGELDKAMLDIATKLGVPPTAASTKYEEVVAPPPSSLSATLSPRKPAEKDPTTLFPTASEDLPALKTKVYEDGRHRQRRAKQQQLPALPSETAKRAQDEQSDFTFH